MEILSEDTKAVLSSSVLETLAEREKTDGVRWRGSADLRRDGWSGKIEWGNLRRVIVCSNDFWVVDDIGWIDSELNEKDVW